MRLNNSSLPAITAAVIILTAGYVHGVWSFRWSATKETNAAAEKLARVPLTFNDWSGVETPLDERQIKLARIDASVSRRYVNSKTGQAVTILLVCGRPGPISVHTPDMCYGGAGYETVGERAKVAIDYDASQPAEFWVLRVKKPDPVRVEGLVIDYGWFTNGVWSAPNVDARLQFAGYPVLYKMYTIREANRAQERPDFDPNTEFLKEFLPVLQNILSPSA